jgi:hypothetical protein
MRRGSGIAVVPLLLIACLVAMTAAVSAGQVQPSKDPQAPALARGEWRIEFRVTGGLIGMDRSLELESSGALKATDRRRKAQVSGRLTQSELDQISSLVTALKTGSVAVDSNCRDCLQYDLTAHVNGRSLVHRLNDVTLSGAAPGPEQQQLIQVLMDLVNRELTLPRTPKEHDSDVVLSVSHSSIHEVRDSRCGARPVAHRQFRVPGSAESAVAR